MSSSSRAAARRSASSSRRGSREGSGGRHYQGRLIASSSMRNVAILGPGGVGGFLAAAPARAGNDVTVVARAPQAGARRGPTAGGIVRDGIRVRSVRLGDYEARPAAVSELDGPVDALLVTTK